MFSSSSSSCTQTDSNDRGAAAERGSGSDSLESQKHRIDWEIEEYSELLSELDRQIFRLTNDRIAARAKKTELEVESRRLKRAIFEEEHGVCPREVISDYTKQMYTCVTHHARPELPRAVEWCELQGFIHPSVSFIDRESWEKCKMTPLEVKAAKVLGRYKEVVGEPTFLSDRAKELLEGATMEEPRNWGK